MDLKDGQDWEVVKFKKHEKKPHVQYQHAKVDENDDEYVPEHISRDKSKEIIKLRLKHKLNQHDLAMKLNMSAKEIHDMENGKFIQDKQKISKVLNYLKRLPTK